MKAANIDTKKENQPPTKLNTYNFNPFKATKLEPAIVKTKE